ncbi:TonB-dependent outer membrane receptorprecursor [Flavobacterium enshiense DK69]|uniref:TonB-dependent receptor n=1 Tax=Flavobacterium enshiense DK69 TaxID=1107311 RepID=V6SEP0_9FLAO|nr:TonB-dependent receptor [Flavobacterium enshiense]ESU22880.1 TonB-dependent outer membrane receptorprecursor [Flavobacterium enshiense DK69]KGO94010.1 TonB-dependent receptor [Flavobacterium enshiense DK69]
MTEKKLLFFILLLLGQFALAQNDSIIKLEELVISDVYLKDNQSQSIQVLNDSVISKNQPSLTHLLNYNSVIYFKEYGRGMLSSVSFRGTTASQTAVVWNGININSQLNGSTDFNTITANDFNSISVKAGGGSVIYGSGAIGGSIHLNNDLEFKKQFKNDFRASYGSFTTLGTNYRMVFSNAKWSSQIGFSYNGSENDYPYVGLYTWKGEQRKNTNGQYYTAGLNVSLGYKINAASSIKFYSQTSNTDRNVSLISESDTKTKYVNGFNRNLIEYVGVFNKLTASLKSAYITENYQYFGDISNDYFSFGKTECVITKFDFGYQVTKRLKLNGVADYNHTKGYGTGFGNNTRQIGSAALMAKWNVNPKWQNEFGIRKEITDNYESPLLFSAGSSYVFSKLYTLRANFSRNFRIPTFNDLYWEEGGNPDLKPESAYQAEIGNVFSFKKITLSQTMYYNKIKDLLRWVPGDGGIWTPQNTDRVQTYGTEVLLEWATNFNKHYFVLNSTYAYTISENEETKKQLFFVPYHKATASIAYSYKKLAANYQFLYNGFVYTRSDNDPNEIIDPYNVSNVGIDYDFGFFDSSKLGFQVLNVFNEKYESLENRPLPGRNFNIYINLKF